MSSRDKIGVAILIGLFVLLGGVMIWVMKDDRPTRTFDPADSPIVQQRIKNLEKSNSR
jgi:hypothetical protein